MYIYKYVYIYICYTYICMNGSRGSLQEAPAPASLVTEVHEGWGMPRDPENPIPFN